LVKRIDMDERACTAHIHFPRVLDFVQDEAIRGFRAVKQLNMVTIAGLERGFSVKHQNREMVKLGSGAAQPNQADRQKETAGRMNIVDNVQAILRMQWGHHSADLPGKDGTDNASEDRWRKARFNLSMMAPAIVTEGSPRALWLLGAQFGKQLGECLVMESFLRLDSFGS
jgi:hypothetical protein